jgi:hypothetical protein
MSHSPALHAAAPFVGVGHGVQPIASQPVLGPTGTQTPPHFFSPLRQPLPPLPPVPALPPLPPLPLEPPLPPQSHGRKPVPSSRQI